MNLADELLDHLRSIPVLARRMLLETPGVQATAPMLRGVWGAALHDLDPEAYQAVFHPEGRESLPAYVIRPAPPDPAFAPAVEWLLIGQAAIGWDATLLLAWGMALQRGLGPDRRPFRVRRIAGLAPDGGAAADVRPWPLAEAVWPLAGDPARTPCRLRFRTPLSLWRDKQLLAEPTLADVVVRTGRRIEPFLPAARRESWHAVRGRAIELAATVPAGRWQGERLDLQRYSSSQDRDFFVPGVLGALDLPAGPGPLWPLLAVLPWIHLGKSTVVGLGQAAIEPLVWTAHGSPPA